MENNKYKEEDVIYVSNGSQDYTRNVIDDYIVNKSIANLLTNNAFMNGRNGDGVIVPVINMFKMVDLLNLHHLIESTLTVVCEDVSKSYSLKLSDYDFTIKDGEVEKERKECSRELDKLKVLKTLYSNTYDYRLFGFSFIQVIRNGLDEIVDLVHMPSLFTRVCYVNGIERYIYLSENGNVFFKKFGDKSRVSGLTGMEYTGAEGDFEASELQFFTEYSNRDFVYGGSCYISLLDSIDEGVISRQYRKNVLLNMGRPEGLIVVEGFEDGVDKIKLRDYIDNISQKVNGRGSFGYKVFGTIGENKKLKFIEFKRDVDLETLTISNDIVLQNIIEATNVSPYRLQIIKEGSLGGTNITESLANYGGSVVESIQVMYEEFINEVLFEMGYKFNFVLERFGEVDEKFIFELYKFGYEIGAISPFEFRTQYSGLLELSDLHDKELVESLNTHFVNDGKINIKDYLTKAVGVVKGLFKGGKNK